MKIYVKVTSANGGVIAEREFDPRTDNTGGASLGELLAAAGFKGSVMQLVRDEGQKAPKKQYAGVPKPRYRYYRRGETYIGVDTSTEYRNPNSHGDVWYDAKYVTNYTDKLEGVETHTVSRDWLRAHCEPMPKNEVPPEWLKAIGYEEA